MLFPRLDCFRFCFVTELVVVSLPLLSAEIRYSASLLFVPLGSLIAFALLTDRDWETKQNLKKWISSYKMLNDVIDIYDAKVVNFGIDFEISVTRDSNKP